MSRKTWIARRSAVLSLALLLGACATASSDRPRVVAPPLQQYSPEFQRKAADQLEDVCPQAPEVCTMIDDYGSLRAAIRKIPNSQP